MSRWLLKLGPMVFFSFHSVLIWCRLLRKPGVCTDTRVMLIILTLEMFAGFMLRLDPILELKPCAREKGLMGDQLLERTRRKAGRWCDSGTRDACWHQDFKKKKQKNMKRNPVASRQANFACLFRIHCLHWLFFNVLCAFFHTDKKGGKKRGKKKQENYYEKKMKKWISLT